MANLSNVQHVPVSLLGVNAGIPNGGALRLNGIAWRPVPVMQTYLHTPTTATTQATAYLLPHPQPLQPTVFSGVVTASLPALTADPTTHGTTIMRASVDTLLPALSASITGAVLIEGDITASLPMFVSNVIGTAPARAVVAAQMPALAAALTITTGPRRALRSWEECPRPTSGFAVAGRTGTLRRGNPPT